MIANGSLFSGGIYTIDNIPVNPDADSIYQIKVEDADNVFIDDTFDVAVPKGAETETSAGQKRLLTEDGNVCTQGDNACISAQNNAQGTINVHVINAETGANVEGSTVNLKNSQTSSGVIIQTATSNTDGIATFEDINYGYYTAETSGSGFDLATAPIDLNSATVTQKLTAKPSNSDFDMILELDVDDADADFDLKMYAQNPSGKECEVSPINKYCAYSQHFKDNQIGENGSEIIRIQDLAVAKYKTTVEPSPAYGTTCPEYQLLASHNSRLLSSSNGGWDWSSFRAKNPMDKISFRVRSLVKKLKQGDIQTLIDALGSSPPVETKPHAKQWKKLLNKAGKKFNGGYDYTTYIKPRNPELVEVELPAEEDVEAVIPIDSEVQSTSNNVRSYHFYPIFNFLLGSNYFRSPINK